MANTETKTITTVADCHVTRIDTASMSHKLMILFDNVCSGENYNKDQIRSAAAMANVLIKNARYEFDLFKYFDSRQPKNVTKI